MYSLLSGIAVTMALAVAALATGSGGSPGALDPSFGQDGVVGVQPDPACAQRCPETGSDAEGSIADALALEPSGAIVLGGERWLARLHANGALDSSFGNGGYAEGLAGLEVLRVFRGAGGELLVVVSQKRRIGLERFTAAGVLDRSFGVGGVRWLTASRKEVEGEPEPRRLVEVDARGRIVVLHEPSSPGTIVVSRFLPSGAPDPTFGRGGLVHLRVLANVLPAGLATERGGVVVVGVSGVRPHRRARLSMVRLTSAGALDRSFGKRGVVRVTGAISAAPKRIFGGPEVVVAAGPSGGIVLVHDEGIKAHTGHGFQNELTLVRYTSGGVLDRSFGVRGVSRAIAAIPIYTTFARDAGFEPEGAAVGAGGDVIVVGAYRLHGTDTSSYSWTLVRYTPHGLDCSFSELGSVGRGDGEGEANAVVVERDGRIVVAGWKYGRGGWPRRGTHEFMAARYVGGGGRTCPGEGRGARMGGVRRARSTVHPRP